MITIVIPMYNSENTIESTLNSIMQQTKINNIQEIIIINDGSTDSSEAKVMKYISDNSDIKISIYNKENGGVSSARNFGIRLAKSDYVALLDSDDMWRKNKLERQMEVLLSNREIDLLGSLVTEKKFKRFLYKRFNFLTKINTKDLIVKNYFQPSTVIFKKEIFNSIGGFPEEQKYAEEGNFFIKASYYYNCYLMNENHIYYGGGKELFGASGLSGNIKEMQKGELKNLKFAKDNNFISKHFYSLAVMYSILKYIRRIVIVKLR